VIEIKVANKALFGTIAAALLALLGVVITGLFTLNSTVRQLSGETERSKAEFLRSQQRDLYGHVLADMGTFEDALAKYSIHIFVSGLTPKEAHDNFASMPSSAELEALQSDRDHVEIVASSQTRDAFTSYIKKEEKAEGILNNITFSFATGGKEVPREKRDEWNKVTADSIQARRALTAAMRTDMGNT
jgi:hypothetical protein